MESHDQRSLTHSTLSSYLIPSKLVKLTWRAKTETWKSSVEVESQRNLTPNVPSGWPTSFRLQGLGFCPNPSSSLLSGGVEQYHISIEWIYSPLLFVIPHFSPYLCSSLLASTLNCRFCVQTPESIFPSAGACQKLTNHFFVGFLTLSSCKKYLTPGFFMS